MPLLFTGPHSQPRRPATDNAGNRNRGDLHIVFKGPAGCLRQWSQGVGTRSIRLPHSSPAGGGEWGPPASAGASVARDRDLIQQGTEVQGRRPRDPRLKGAKCFGLRLTPHVARKSLRSSADKHPAAAARDLADLAGCALFLLLSFCSSELCYQLQGQERHTERESKGEAARETRESELVHLVFTKLHRRGT